MKSTMSEQTNCDNLIFPSISALVIFIIITCSPKFSMAVEQPIRQKTEISIESIPASMLGGYGYELQYVVPVPLDAYWRFKTDFDNSLLLSSQTIIDHRLVQSVGNRVITENRYASAPSLRFLWLTTVNQRAFQLDFVLLNLTEARHKFHYGSIRLIPAGKNTIVTQKAYFNFKGASFWVNYPWYGGMKYTLKKVARWEQKIAVQHMQQAQ